MAGDKENALRVQRNLVYAFVALMAVFAVGTAGYYWLGEGEYSWLDCFYMTFITLSTIGYSETVDVTHYEYGRLFTIFIGIAGIGVLGYTLSTLTAFMLENNLNESWRRKKMRQKIEQLSGHYIVCGIGYIGSNVAHELAATGREYVIVDPDMAALERFREIHPDQMYVCGDATDDDVLIAAGIARARGVFAVVSNDSQNLMISLSARQLNEKLRIVARCHDPKNLEKTRKAGADEVISPDYTGGLRIVSAMLSPNVVGFLDEMHKSASKLRMEEIQIPAALHGKTVGSLSSGGQDCLVLAIQRQGEWKFNPPGSHLMNQGDLLMVMATPQGRTQLELAIQAV